MELIIIMCAVLAYFAPSIIAWRKKHRNENAIAFINLAVGWTVIGWFTAFIWACTGKE